MLQGQEPHLFTSPDLPRMGNQVVWNTSGQAVEVETKLFAREAWAHHHNNPSDTPGSHITTGFWHQGSCYVNSRGRIRSCVLPHPHCDPTWIFTICLYHSPIPQPGDWLCTLPHSNYMLFIVSHSFSFKWGCGPAVPLQCLSKAVAAAGELDLYFTLLRTGISMT